MLKISGKTALGGGPYKATSDLAWPSYQMEVKSTLNRYESFVTVHGEYQLGQGGTSATQFLTHVRFEPGLGME